MLLIKVIKVMGFNIYKLRIVELIVKEGDNIKRIVNYGTLYYRY
jgi:hypothetical protein